MTKIENYQQKSSCLDQNLGKTTFLHTGKKEKKKRYVTLCLVVWWVEWDKIFAFITYVEKLDRFTKSTYTYWTWGDSEYHHQQSLESRMILTTSLYSVFDAESEKNISTSWKEEESRKFCMFWTRCVFFEKRHLRSISHFSTGSKYLLRLRSTFSWSAAHVLPNDVKKMQNKNFTRNSHCRHLTPVNQTPLDVLGCSSCTPALCTTNYPTQCPSTNSQINSACQSVNTNQPSTSTKSIGVSISDSTMKYLLVGSVALASFLGTYNLI
jgi:hypothetical protein